MAYNFNPFTGNLDDVGAGAAAFEVLGTVATVGDLPGGATQSDVYLVEADNNFYVWDGSAWSSLGTLAGPQGPTGATGAVGPAGADGADGADGVGVDAGGTTGQVLAKASNTDYDTEWVDQTGGGGTPGGSDTQVQFNDGGAFGGDSGLTYNDTAGALTVGGKTTTTDSPVLNLSQTWNNAATTFTGLKLNVTNTASAGGSKLLDLQVSGTTSFSVSPSGNLSGIFSTAATSGGTAIGNSGNFSLLLLPGTTKFAAGSIVIASSIFGDNTDGVNLFRDGSSDVLGQRRGTNAQTYRLYNTWGNNGVDFERTSITRDSSGLVIDAQKGGTGVDPTNLLDVKLDGTSQLQVNRTGQIYRSNVPATGGIRLKINNSTTDYGISDNDGHVNIVYNSNIALSVTSDKLGLGQGRYIGFGSARSIDPSDLGLARDSAGVLKITDGSTGTGYLRQVPIAVASLPTAAAGNAGTRIFVSDASVAAAGNFGSVVAGGGSNTVPVYSDGGAWRIG